MMDAVSNPYAPGAGALPPALEGRDAVREQVRTSIARIRRGKAAKSVLMVGLRGVGKTVLLENMRKEADLEGAITLWVEAPEDRSLPAIMAPQLRQALLRLSGKEKVKELASRGLRALAGFVKALKVKYSDIQVSVDFDPEPGLADAGDLDLDLTQLFEVVGEAAAADETAVVLFVDELQYVAENQLAALITALHRAAQRQLPITLVGAGLPQLRGRMGKAKSYAERLFDFPRIEKLPPEAARAALEKPAWGEGVVYEDAAIERILKDTEGYPYFLQEWGKHAWDAADESPIDENDVKLASKIAVAALDESFFRVRFDRLKPSEKRYLRAMAELGAGPHRSGEIAAEMDKKVESVAPVRNTLIGKGMIYSPTHGETAFTVPMFDAFMKRIMPGDEWKTS